ncbi:N-acetylmuramoyl-L-alanine amidase [Geosporobacter subterraneus DSM 17957]|uniref:N-acetylmuramoyl-L-alanine amidase n=1 Tax=Geosporobacter subterraneus DSM 17957 TaxID=1121919 RepID=A0A1M6FTQ4_9FIRM|nr:N-acetylmuramoyl-L-alanine amidase [Geosporobacter subterraneus]SHJ01081.1 N-acetylmuramoyl-L-alanine amidase [Geosporobacter subterraneus DSM 17957]
MAYPILIIDPGHGGKDSGGGSNNHWKEKDFVLDISLYQFTRFQELNLPVTMTRSADIYLDARTRTKIVRESGAPYCISNHINAGGGEGAETIYSLYSDGNLARGILEELRRAGQPVRRAFTRASDAVSGQDYYFMHRQTGKVKTVIIEYGFADHPEEIKRLQRNWMQYGEAVVKAFCCHLGHPYQSNQEQKLSQRKYEGIEYLYQKGIIIDYERWRQKIDEPMPRWEAALLLQKLHESLESNG